MEAKLTAVFAAGLTGISVSALCAELEISRQSFYKYKKRFETEGPPGLVERSRRPHRSPGGIGLELEERIVRLRKELAEEGLDAGAATIAAYLEREAWLVPALSTIHRALRRRGLVVDQPAKRPRSATRRFVWERPNDAWQIDATRWLLADGEAAWVMDVLDDHSRLVVAAVVRSGPTGEAAWSALCAGAERYGLPARVMSDNGSCFTARLFSGGEADFERDLRGLGIRHIPSSPGHPQTCGKIERFHQTLKRWLGARPLAATHAELQAQLDAFVEHYNTLRPHRALRGATPLAHWSASAPAGPGEPIPEPGRVTLHTVGANGSFGWKAYSIGVGQAHAGERMVVVARGDDLALFGQGGLIRRLTLDRTRRGQPRGARPGRQPTSLRSNA